MKSENARDQLGGWALPKLGRSLALALLLVAFLGFAVAPVVGAQVAREGILRATISENFVSHESTTAYSLSSGGKTTPLLPTTPVLASTGDRVEAEGTMHDGQLVGQVAQTQDLTPTANVVGPRRVAVLMMRFPGDAAEPWSLSQARQEVFTGEKSANAHLQEETWGLVSLTGKENNTDGDVFGWFTVNNPSGCPSDTWNAEARQQAQQQGISLAGYNHIIFISTFQFGCGWLGQANLGSQVSGQLEVNINGTFGGSQVIAHELGHNLSLRHAGSWTCTNGGKRVAISNSCTIQEYGDPFDVMGNLGMRHSSGWNYEKLGLIGSANGSVESVTADGDYTLWSTLNSSATSKVLRIARPGSPSGNYWYYLEVRQKGGLFENFDDATMTGVSIRAIQKNQAAETRLIDTNPATADFSDAPLKAGRTFYDGNVHVTVLSAGGGTATVRIGFGAFTDAQAPTIPANVSASQNTSGVRLQWNESDDNVGVTSYLVYRDGSEIGSSPSPFFTDTTASLGTHAYTVYAKDEANNTSGASSPKVFEVTDVQGPTAPTSLSASLDTNTGNVTLQWNASTDNLGVTGYVVTRNGLQIGATPAQALIDSGVPVGKHTYTVYAEDAAGNSSTGAVAVVTVPGPATPDTPPTTPTPTPSPGPSGGQKQSRPKPVLRWQRRAGGGVVFKLDASAFSEIYRVSLWLGSAPLFSKSGDALSYVWKPRIVRCGAVYRVIGRAHESSGKEVSSVVRLKASDVGGRVGKCRGRASH